jgi:hypothetical protein
LPNGHSCSRKKGKKGEHIDISQDNKFKVSSRKKKEEWLTKKTKSAARKNNEKVIVACIFQSLVSPLSYLYHTIPR